MSITVTQELMYLETQIEKINEIQRERDKAEGKNPTRTARDRLAADR